MRTLLAMMLMALSMSACDGATRSGAEAPSPTPDPTRERSTLIALATAGLVPERAVVATATPDLTDALPPDAAVALLSEDRKLDAIISAVAQREVNALIERFHWEPRHCTGMRGSAICKEYDGALVDTVRVGPTTEYAQVDVVRRYLDVVFDGTPLTLKLAIQSRTHESWVYILGFEGPPKAVGFAPLASADSHLTGFLLGIDLSQEEPVVHFDLLTDTWTATNAGRRLIDNAPEDFRLLLFSE